MTEKDQQRVAERLIEILGAVERHRGMFLASDDPEAVEALLTGMILALQACGFEALMPRRDLVRDSLLEKLGWGTPRNLISQMRKKGVSNHLIIREIISVEIEAIRRRIGTDNIERSG